MNIDFQKIENDLVGVIKGTVKKETPAIKEYAAQIIEDQKESLKELAELRLSGKITDDQLKSELEDLEETIKNQGLALKVMTKAAAQRTTNAILSFLQQTITSIVNTVK